MCLMPSFLLELKIPSERWQDGEEADLFGIYLKLTLLNAAFISKENKIRICPIVDIIYAENPMAISVPVIVFPWSKSRA